MLINIHRNPIKCGNKYQYWRRRQHDTYRRWKSIAIDRPAGVISILIELYGVHGCVQIDATFSKIEMHIGESDLQKLVARRTHIPPKSTDGIDIWKYGCCHRLLLFLLLLLLHYYCCWCYWKIITLLHLSLASLPIFHSFRSIHLPIQGQIRYDVFRFGVFLLAQVKKICSRHQMHNYWKSAVCLGFGFDIVRFFLRKLYLFFGLIVAVVSSWFYFGCDTHCCDDMRIWMFCTQIGLSHDYFYVGGNAI